MNPYTRNLILLLISFLPLSDVVAQDLPQEFTLPVARLGENYRVEVESVLRDKYRLRVDAGKANAVVMWAMASGEMPYGLSIRTDGTIIGNAKDARVGPYEFSLKAVDIAVRDEPLELRFFGSKIGAPAIDENRRAEIGTGRQCNARFKSLFPSFIRD